MPEAIVDTEIERYQRMAEQTHPQILPLCVETLQTERDKLAGISGGLEEASEHLNRHVYSDLGATALTLTSVEVAAFMANNLLHANLDNLTILIVGAAMISLRALRNTSVAVFVNVAHGRAKEQTQQMESLYSRARDRAVEMGLVSDGLEANLS